MARINVHGPQPERAVNYRAEGEAPIHEKRVDEHTIVMEPVAELVTKADARYAYGKSYREGGDFAPYCSATNVVTCSSNASNLGTPPPPRNRKHFMDFLDRREGKRPRK